MRMPRRKCPSELSQDGDEVSADAVAEIQLGWIVKPQDETTPHSCSANSTAHAVDSRLSPQAAAQSDHLCLPKTHTPSPPFNPSFTQTQLFAAVCV